MQDCDVFNSQEDDADNARLARETDLLFGKWPERLLNYRVSFLKSTGRRTLTGPNSGGGGILSR